MHTPGNPCLMIPPEVFRSFQYFCNKKEILQ